MQYEDFYVKLSRHATAAASKISLSDDYKPSHALDIIWIINEVRGLRMAYIAPTGGLS